MYTDNILEHIISPALWCAADTDSTELARVASVAIEQGVGIISASPADVGILWPWLENKNIKILSRFYLTHVTADDISNITTNINSALKRGADGAQVFVSLNNLSEFISQIYCIRDDLFFNKSVYIGVDIGDIGPFDWSGVYANAQKLRANGIVLALTSDTGDDSDFVGRIYAALNAWRPELNLDLHFILGASPMRIEQVTRLIKSIRPELMPGVRFFVNI